MGSKFEFDDTRDAIGSDHLTQDERKAMFDKFKSSGGQVVNEKLLREQNQEAALKKRGSGQMSERETFRQKKREEALKKAQAREHWEKTEKKLKSAPAKFFIKLRCWMSGLSPFSKPEVKPEVMSFLSVDVKQALVEFNLLGNDLFFRRPEVGKKIVKILDSRNSLFMEILERAHSLYNSEEYNKLIEFSEKNRNINTPLEFIGEPVKKLFLRLYYLFPFQDTLKRAFNLAFEIYKKEVKEGSDIETIGVKQKKLQKDIKIVFQTAFPKLLSLISLDDSMEYTVDSPFLEKAIGVKAEDKLGKRKVGEGGALSSSVSGADEEKKEEGENSEQDEKKEEKPEDNPVLQTKDYQYGISLMKMYSLDQLVKKIDPQKRYSVLPLNDKVLLSYLYFAEFDKEYSFVLTTNKIQLNVDYVGGTKHDYKEVLTSLYDTTRDIMRAFEKYVTAKKEYKEITKSKSVTNYIDQSKLESKIKSQIDMEGRQTRGLIRTFMANTAKNLGVLIEDMKEKKQIVLNMDESLKFSADLEGAKRMNGKTVSQCILTAYCYATALKERLSTGDFFGGIIEMPDEDMQQSFGDSYKEALLSYTS
ncbi:MAG: hypothetical protein OEZ22_13660 [Spirochaetia bacterium]|nr:hypothetical protein [Spirochaetia bacterium]